MFVVIISKLTKDSCGNLLSKKFSRANLFLANNIGNINLADTGQLSKTTYLCQAPCQGRVKGVWSPGEAVRDSQGRPGRGQHNFQGHPGQVDTEQGLSGQEA